MKSATDFPAEFSSKSLRRRKLKSERQRLLWHLSVKTPPLVWRLFEVFLASCVALLLAPLLGTLYVVAKLKGGGIRRTSRLGRDAKEFEEYSLYFGAEAPRSSFVRWLSRLPALLNLMRAHMSLVGPRTMSRGEFAFQESMWKRFDARPGFVGLWWLRKQTNIAYESEAQIDAEYADSKSPKQDLGILLRSLPAAFYGGAAAAAGDKIAVLNVTVDNLDMEEAIGHIRSGFNLAKSMNVCFVNADCVNIAQRDSDYVALLDHSPLVLADGIGLKLAGNLLGTPIKQNVNGTDLIPRLCARMAEEQRSVYLLGGKPGVAGDVAAWMLRSFPGIRIAGERHGYFNASETADVVEEIRASKADLLLVAMGAPKQDKWVRDHLPSTGVPVGMGVGGLFDFYSGRMDRAPQWVRELGMEWFFRLAKEPGRMWKRYLLGNGVFLMRVLARRAHLTRATAMAKAAPAKSLETESLQTGPLQ